MARKIILVDNDRFVLKEMSSVFKENNYDLLCFESAENALIHLSENPVDLVISDIRMRVMEGVELLRKVKERYPQTLRVVIGRKSESHLVYRSIEENLAKMYYFKPINNGQLLKVVEDLFEYESKLRDKKILEFVNNMEDLPTVPKLYQSISAMIAMEEDMDKIAALIESDQAMSAKILRIGNSAYFGKKTGSIKQAIMYIGLTNVRNIVLASSVFIIDGDLRQAMTDLWQHSTLTNRFTNLFYQSYLGKKLPTSFASAGLLHNIGMVGLLRHHYEKYKKILQNIDLHDQTFKQKEIDSLGISHQELGACLLDWWELPPPIVETALYHHDPLNETIINKELVQIVHIANAMAWVHLKGSFEGDTWYVQECCEALELDTEQVITFFQELDTDSTL